MTEQSVPHVSSKRKKNLDGESPKSKRSSEQDPLNNKQFLKPLKKKYRSSVSVEEDDDEESDSADDGSFIKKPMKKRASSDKDYGEYYNDEDDEETKETSDDSSEETAYNQQLILKKQKKPKKISTKNKKNRKGHKTPKEQQNNEKQLQLKLQKLQHLQLQQQQFLQSTDPLNLYQQMNQTQLQMLQLQLFNAGGNSDIILFKKPAGILSPNFSLNTLEIGILRKILCFIKGGRDLSAMVVTCRLMKQIISTSQEFTERIRRTKVCMGFLLKMEAKHSPFFNFEQLIEELMKRFPDLVIHCEVDDNEQNSVGIQGNYCDTHDSSSKYSQLQAPFVLINDDQKFAVQALSPSERQNAKDGLLQHVGVMAQKAKAKFPSTGWNFTDIKNQSWFLNVDRKEVERILSQQQNGTFCIRPSATPNSFALSYKHGKNILHSLISPWKQNWYFSGNMNHEGIIHGLFFSSIPHLMWYWKNYGLGQKWIPLDI